jgi:hypothetical protein
MRVAVTSTKGLIGSTITNLLRSRGDMAALRRCPGRADPRRRAGSHALAAERGKLADPRGVPEYVSPPMLSAFREQWEPKYATFNIWNTVGEPAS